MSIFASQTINKPPTPQPMLLHVIYLLLLDEDSPVSDLAVLKIMQSLLNTILVVLLRSDPNPRRVSRSLKLLCVSVK